MPKSQIILSTFALAFALPLAVFSNPLVQALLGKASKDSRQSVLPRLFGYAQEGWCATREHTDRSAQLQDCTPDSVCVPVV